MCNNDLIDSIWKAARQTDVTTKRILKPESYKEQ